MCQLPSLPAYLDCFTKNFHQGVADLLQLRVTLLVLHCPTLLLTLRLQEAGGVRHLGLVLHQRAGGVGHAGDVEGGRGEVHPASPGQVEAGGQ